MEVILILLERVTVRYSLSFPLICLMINLHVSYCSFSSLKSTLQIMRFCQSFMNEMYRYLGPDKVS